ncbi:enoyl-ACP reductase [Planctomycetota bacterium]
MSFLNLEGKNILVLGVANKKSVAYHAGKVLLENGAVPVFSVQNDEIREAVQKLFPANDVYVCDVEHHDQIRQLATDVTAKYPVLHGIVHAIGFANYGGGFKSFHETPPADFLQAVNISCYSIIGICDSFRANLDPDASVVAISISTTRMAAENYGYMAPVKAALDSTMVFLAKSFSAFSCMRFNTVNAGLLKTSASAGIPGYVDSYLYAEKATLRKRGVTTPEVANTVAFLLSPVSGGINAQGIVVDAGMSANYFDKDIVTKAVRPD